MRKKIQNFEQPNLIVDSLDKPRYASTYIGYTCDVHGPECNEEEVSEDDMWKSDWKDASDFPEHRNNHDAYDFHICPDCQKTNCMECFHGVLEDSGRCDNKNCEYHDNCRECGEPYYQSNSGKAYCENKECSKYNSLGESTRAIENLKISTKNYWVTCDGSPNCEADGWNPKYDRMPEGWHRREHHRHDESSTDYCKNCWDHFVCHECEEPYRDDELKQEFIDNDSQVCHNPSCYMHNKCFCGSEVDKFGNCLDEKNYDASGDKKYSDGYCERGKYCRQCDTNSRNNDHHECYNPECIAYVVPQCDHEGCDKKADVNYDDYNNYYGGGSDWERERYHYCKEHKPLHCTETIEPSYGYNRIYPGCGGLLAPSGRCKSCKPNAYDDINWGFDKKAHYTYEDDPNYPDEPLTIQHCDYPGCTETKYPDNPVVYEPMKYAYDWLGNERHYCKEHFNQICPECKVSEDDYGRCNNEACDSYYTCPECGEKNKKGVCQNDGGYCTLVNIPRENCGSCEQLLTHGKCNNRRCRNFINPHKGLWS